MTSRSDDTLDARLKQIVEVLQQHRFRFTCEKDLQDGIEQVLKNCGSLPFEREPLLTERDRSDFRVGAIVLEVKIKGSLSEVTRQLMRYANIPTVEALILVTTKMQHRNMPPTMRGKPLRVVWLPGF